MAIATVDKRKVLQAVRRSSAYIAQRATAGTDVSLLEEQNEALQNAWDEAIVQINDAVARYGSAKESIDQSYMNISVNLPETAMATEDQLQRAAMSAAIAIVLEHWLLLCGNAQASQQTDSASMLNALERLLDMRKAPAEKCTKTQTY